ncbi:hypothetical protein O1611_g3643 [Lasiodiplodia mahajangana]|uniref:Uncharacterized protein n=1 Tax=Lasiodiplodia mahajangana TaxID=1108764 RepID=A0ACC2JRU2_9PEZI|nr:hypothetical protein O1611_g3643 [Lasiodiplodia mahajangana]
MYKTLIQSSDGRETPYLWSSHTPCQRRAPSIRTLPARPCPSHDDNCDGDGYSGNYKEDGISPSLPTNLTRLTESEVVGSRYRAGVALFGSSSDEDAVSAAASGRNPTTTSLSCGTNHPTSPLVLSDTEPTPKNKQNALGNADTPSRGPLTFYQPNLVPYPQGRAIAVVPLPRGAYDYCITQQQAKAVARIQVGRHSCITRWARGSKLKYSVNKSSFASGSLAILVENSATVATSMWQGIGVTFEPVPSNSPATFQIQYRDLPSDRESDVYAESFFPQDGANILFVYELALKEDNIAFLANVLAHELGHVLGLRHEFASDICERTGRTRESRCVRWGAENENSIMNKYADLRDYVVQPQDLDELQSFYDYTGATYGNMVIRDFEPQLFPFAGE